MLYSLLCGLLCLALFVRLVLWFRRKSYSGDCQLQGKTVIITGANTGVGREVALDVARRGARVILACRNEEKARIAALDIIEQTGNPDVVVKVVDVSRLRSVRSFAESILREEERVDILINNAGISGFVGNKLTEDGYDMTWATNYLGHFLLTLLLLDLLKKSGKSRVVNVTSIMHWVGRVDMSNFTESIRTSADKSPSNVYGCTKLAQILSSLELSRKFAAAGVSSFACHPGAVLTDIYKDTPFLYKLIIHSIAPFYYRSPKQGAQCVLYCALEEGIPAGKYYSNCGLGFASAAAKDSQLARQLWEKTELEVSKV